MNKFFAIILFVTIEIGCLSPSQTFDKIPPGIWRATLLLDRTPAMPFGDDRDIKKKFDVESELPFNFEVVYDNDSVFHLVIHNAEERIRVDDITFGRDKATGKDTLTINFPVYDTQIKALYEDGVMEGDWIVNYKDNYRIPFKATHGNDARFMASEHDYKDISGKWDCTFEIGTEDEYKAVGLFDQKKNLVSGTFMTETGDYRFLEGKAFGSKVYLSAFDGAHAFLFLGKVMEDGKLSGIFRSGSQYTTNWEGIKNASAALQDPYALTKTISQAPLAISLEDQEGRMVNINDGQFKDKIKIVQVMGTWCPNCMDETIFLRDYFSKNPSDDLAWISIGFERYKDKEKAKQSLRRFKDKMGLNHTILYGGINDKKEALKVLPQLDKIMSYPTLIIADQKNNIVKIHTGFSGPATPEYTKFKTEFDEIIRQLRQK